MTTLPNSDQRPDIVLEDEGSIFLARPLSEEAKAWESANVDPDVPRWCEAFVVKPSQFDAVLAQMLADGLLVATGGEL